MSKTIRPLPINEEHCLHFAMRYALGRVSTAPSIVSREIALKWPRLQDYTKWAMKREITEAIARDEAGRDCDIESWQAVLNLPNP